MFEPPKAPIETANRMAAALTMRPDDGDAALICSNLVHPQVHPSVTIGAGLSRLAHCATSAMTWWTAPDVIRAVSSVGSVISRRGRHSPLLPKDVAKRTADEMDYLTLVFRDRYGGRLWSFTHARSIAELFGTCASEQDFQHRVRWWPIC
jgi:hypothetical protein